MKKKELADLAVRLFNNIDQAEQFSVNELFYHCDTEYLLETIERFIEIVKYNIERDKKLSILEKNVLIDNDELKEIFDIVKEIPQIKHDSLCETETYIFNT